jgi:CheY-like chemotaxis protein
MTMPGMTGDILAAELMKIRPDIPVVICTGYSERIDEQRARALGIKGLIMKPFTIRGLSKTVRAVLDGKG